MKKVFIIHGFNGSPNGGWRPWLMGELAKYDIYGCSLPMPRPNSPIKEEWLNTISGAVGDLREEIFLVGHSLGVPAILRYLETLKEKEKVGGVVLVSGPFNLIKRNGYENVNKFLEDSFDFEKIKKVCKNFVIIHGDNDKAVPFSDALKYSEIFSCNLITIHNGGHLNGFNGWRELPEVLESLLKMMKINKKD
jgi:predicted alpha/beta hydrolase family esterase